jgi:hypothetical protein
MGRRHAAPQPQAPDEGRQGREAVAGCIYSLVDPRVILHIWRIGLKGRAGMGDCAVPKRVIETLLFQGTA